MPFLLASSTLVTGENSFFPFFFNSPIRSLGLLHFLYLFFYCFIFSYLSYFHLVFLSHFPFFLLSFPFFLPFSSRSQLALFSRGFWWEFWRLLRWFWLPIWSVHSCFHGSQWDPVLTVDAVTPSLLLLFSLALSLLFLLLSLFFLPLFSFISAGFLPRGTGNSRWLPLDYDPPPNNLPDYDSGLICT